MLKKFAAGIVLSIAASTAIAGGAHHHHHHGHGWGVPLVVGAIVGGVIAATVPQPVYGYPHPIPPPVYGYPHPIPTPQVMKKRIDVYVPECNCIQTVTVYVPVR